MNTNHQLVSTPTSISLDFFSGFDFVSLTNSDDKEFWHVTTIDHLLAIHVNKVSLCERKNVHNWPIFRETKSISLFVLIKVSSDCGTCATLKFKQSHQIDGLGPAKLTVYPTLASIRSKEAYKQIFHIKSFNTTQFGQPTMLKKTGKIKILVAFAFQCYQVTVFLPFLLQIPRWFPCGL